MKKCGSSKSTKDQCGSGNQRQTGKTCKAKVRGSKRGRLPGEDLMEMTVMTNGAKGERRAV